MMRIILVLFAAWSPVAGGGCQTDRPATLAATSNADTSLGPRMGAPYLGFAVGFDSGVIHPLRGVPGAALAGPPLPMPAGFLRVLPSPGRLTAIVTRDEGSAPLLVTLEEAFRPLFEFPEAPAGSLQLIWSPSGRAVAFYSTTEARAVVYGELHRQPASAGQFEFGQQDALPSAVAVNDTASTLLAVFFDSHESAPNVSVERRPGLSVVAVRGSVAAATFLCGSDEAVLVDGAKGLMYLLSDLSESPSVRLLDGGLDAPVVPVGLRSSADGATVFIADAYSGSIFAYQVRDGALTSTLCGCVPQGLEPLGQPGLFQLTTAGSGPVYVFDGGPFGPRIIPIPPAPE